MTTASPLLRRRDDASAGDLPAALSLGFRWSLAHVVLTPVNDAASLSTAPLVEMGQADAQEHGETTIQLREAERYEYEGG